MTIASMEAPGKVLLIGEYAVLEGAPAVVAAVDRSVCVRPAPVGVMVSAAPLVDLACNATCQELGLAVPAEPLSVDSSAFCERERKIGLGSSAAVTVAVSAWLFAQAGHDVTDKAVRARLLPLAKRIHDAFQGTPGSGSDIAASLFGGVSTVRPDTAGPPHVAPFVWPTDLHLIFLWTGQPASTPALVRAVRAALAASGSAVRNILEHMAMLSRAFVQPAVAPAVLMTLLREYGAAMAELGSAAGVSLVTKPMATAMQMADSLGGAAKPSGAGGGDLLVAALPSARAGEDFLRACAGLPLVPIALAVDPYGVRPKTRRQP